MFRVMKADEFKKQVEERIFREANLGPDASEQEKKMVLELKRLECGDEHWWRIFEYVHDCPYEPHLAREHYFVCEKCGSKTIFDTSD